MQEEKRKRILIVAVTATLLLGIFTLSARGLSPADAAIPADMTAPAEVSPAVTAGLLKPSAAPTAEPTATPYIPSPPELTLQGDNPLVISASVEPYADPGCTSVDTLDGDLSGSVVTVVDVDPYRAGEGSVHYAVTDSEGLSSDAVRQVIVQAVPTPETTEPSSKVIYLTFDDGPSVNTPRLLDILDSFNVKATWFVTLDHTESTELISEIYRRGHAVAIHSASHDYDRIYSGEEAFFADIREIRDVIWECTGVRSTLLRFPGGSSNTVSCFNPGIMTRLAACLNDMGWLYFDWNVSSADTDEYANTWSVIRNVTSGCAEQPWSVVLQHDTCDFSVDAVPAIVEWGLQNGYSFRALDEHSPTAHHSIAN